VVLTNNGRKVAGAKDLDKTVSFYDDDAVVMRPNEPMVISKDGIRNLWKGFSTA
jgi:ketosteroid isomerase-like protein